MRVEILGSAAGGGFPQWNCGCRNCRSLRAGTFSGKSRTQTQVAISRDMRSWYLLNASPDLRVQIEATPVFHPQDASRGSPVEGVLLTGGDLDQIAGLLSLRELQPLRVYCTASLRHLLQESNVVFGMLNRVSNQVAWMEVSPDKSFPLLTVSGDDSGLRCEPFSLGWRYPAYVEESRAEQLASEEALLGLMLGVASGKRLAYLPTVPAIDDALLARLETADVLLFDGTFWSDNELMQVQGNGATAREMGHVPVSSEEGSLRKLAGLRRPRKIFLHVNNTNPMLNESGPQYQQVRAAGWEIAEDGWSFDL